MARYEILSSQARNLHTIHPKDSSFAKEDSWQRNSLTPGVVTLRLSGVTLSRSGKVSCEGVLWTDLAVCNRGQETSIEQREVFSGGRNSYEV
jgi:hypothetical protein